MMTPNVTTTRQLIENFVAAVHVHDAAAARRVLAPDYELVFPGPVRFFNVDEVFDWFSNRYASARYSYGHMDIIEQAGRIVVYAAGSVAGALLDGSRFSDVRYIDRFDIVDGKIARKEVWSDMSDLLRKLGK